jgi:NAD(P)H-hydrate epimerase
VIPIVTPEEMAAIDKAAPEPVEVLIERAGSAVARLAREMLGGTYGRTVAVVTGKGNNGNDGRAAAALLAARGVRVRMFDAADCPPQLPPADLVIDAAYGTGFRGEWRAPRVGAAPVLAVDIPSGVDGLTGEAGRGVLAADRTVTFAALKPGLLLGPGRILAGDVEVVDIGLDTRRARAQLVEAEDVAQWWRPRPPTAHKWIRAVRIVAGSPGMTGAAHLASAAAMRAGSGMVSLSTPGTDGSAPAEVVRRRLPAFDWSGQVLDDLHRYHALVVGPGLGREPYTVAAVRATVTAATVPLVVDGDGLFALAWDAEGAAPVLHRRTSPTVLTPHDGEYGLLAGHSPGPDRFMAARRLAADLRTVVLLKGPVTVVAAPGGDVLVVANGDARLATAGTGDVLSGILGAQLATGLDPFRAAATAAWLHAEAARSGPARGLVAGDIIDALPGVLERLHQ